MERHGDSSSNSGGESDISIGGLRQRLLAANEDLRQTGEALRAFDSEGLKMSLNGLAEALSQAKAFAEDVVTRVNDGCGAFAAAKESSDRGVPVIRQALDRDPYVSGSGQTNILNGVDNQERMLHPMLDEALEISRTVTDIHPRIDSASQVAHKLLVQGVELDARSVSAQQVNAEVRQDIEDYVGRL